MSPGNPKAHFTLSRPTSAAVNPAIEAVCSRVFEALAPQLSQRGPDRGLNPAEDEPHIASGFGVVLKACETGFPVTNSARARRSGAARRTAMVIIGPDSMAASTRSGIISRNASRLGARSSPASCHEAQWTRQSAAPAGVWADRSEAQTSVIATQMTMRCVGRFIRASLAGL